MSTTNSKSTIASRLKVQYAKGPSQLIPESTEILTRCKFREDLKPGEKAQFDVQLSHEAGFTTGLGEFDLNGSVAQETAKAEVTGWQVILQSRASYDLIKAATNNDQAFIKFNNTKFIPMVDSFQKRLETLLTVGQGGLGVVQSCVAGVITITEASWCPFRFTGAKGTKLNAYTLASVAGVQHNGDLAIVSTNLGARQITVSGTSAAVVAGDILFYQGGHQNEPIGLMTIAKNKGSLYGIDASVYELWQANEYDVGTSKLTLAKLLEASALSSDKGMDGKLTCFVPTRTFQSLVADEAAMVQHGAKYNKAKVENGFESIMFYGCSGSIEVVPHKGTSWGEFVMFDERTTYRIGSSEATNRMNEDKGDIYFDLESKNAVEMRTFAEQTLFSEFPGYITWGKRSDGKALHV